MQPYRKHSEVSMKVKAFSCPMCNYSSDYLHTIKRHMDSHTNTKFCLISEPTLVCLKKPYYHSHLSFHQWVQTPGNIYIGGNAKKYCPPGYKEDSMWVNRKLLLQVNCGDITRAEFLKQYEAWVRNHMMEYVPTLANKVLGCWCTNFQECHGHILKKVWRYYPFTTVHSVMEECKFQHKVQNIYWYESISLRLTLISDHEEHTNPSMQLSP